MKLARIFAILVATFVAVSALPLQADNSPEKTEKPEVVHFRLSNDTVPIHYDVKVNPHVADENFSFLGETRVDFQVRKRTSDVALHVQNIRVEESATKLTTPNGEIRVPVDYKYNNETDILVISFAEPLEPGTYSLRIKYLGTIADDRLGLYSTWYENDEGNTVWMVATQFEATYARRMFPCWDEPAFKATFNVSVKHHTNYTAHSNMPVRMKSEVDETDGKIWTHFEKTPIMSTYLVAVVISDYEKLSNADETINIWTRKKFMPYAKEVLDIAEKSARELEKYTNISVRVPKMDHISIPTHAAGAMENWGLITYPESKFNFNRDEVRLSSIMENVLTIIHELAHQWFGNVVSPTWWSHVWLNEGFASYFEHYVIEKILPSWRGRDYFMMSVFRESLDVDIISHIKPIDAEVNSPSEIDSAFSMASYGKAPSILHMLSNIVTEDVFHKGLMQYLDRHQFDSANPDCLWRALQNALDESDVPHNDFNVKNVMDTWIEQKRYPLITVDRDYSTGEMRITQEDFGTVQIHEHDYDDEDYSDEGQVNRWWIPVNFATKTDPDFLRTTPTHWLTPEKNVSVDGINADDWVIVNKQMTGYYRVNYDEANWEKIAEYLNSDDYTKIHILNRAQIINDAAELAENHRLKPAIFFKLLNYLSKETDYLPWHFAFDFFRSTEHYLNHPEAATLRSRATKLLKKLYDSASFEVKPDDDPFTVIKNFEVITWMCRLGDTECREAATAKLVKFLEDPENNKISPILQHVIYCEGMRNANETLWEKMWEMFANNPDWRILREMRCVQNPTMIEKYLNLSLGNDTIISDSRRISLFYWMFENPPAMDQLLDFLLSRWDDLTNRLEYVGSTVFGITRRVRTAQQMEKLKQLYKIYGMDEAEAAKTLQKRGSEIEKAVEVIRQWTNALP